METRVLPAVTIFNACATVRQKHVVCIPEMPKVNLPLDICHMKPQLRLKFVTFEAGKYRRKLLLPPHWLQWDIILALCGATSALTVWSIRIAHVLYI